METLSSNLLDLLEKHREITRQIKALYDEKQKVEDQIRRVEFENRSQRRRVPFLAET